MFTLILDLLLEVISKKNVVDWRVWPGLLNNYKLEHQRALGSSWKSYATRMLFLSWLTMQETSWRQVMWQEIKLHLLRKNWSTCLIRLVVMFFSLQPTCWWDAIQLGHVSLCSSSFWSKKSRFLSPIWAGDVWNGFNRKLAGVSDESGKFLILFVNIA